MADNGSENSAERGDKQEVRRLWAIEWRSKNRLDGERRYLIGAGAGHPIVFKTRSAARKYRDAQYGYLRDRRDLKAEPHGWRVPRVVKVEVAFRWS